MLPVSHDWESPANPGRFNVRISLRPQAWSRNSDDYHVMLWGFLYDADHPEARRLLDRRDRQWAVLLGLAEHLYKDVHELRH